MPVRGGETTLAEINERFGPDVAKIVDQCSDTFEDPKPPWQERKERYIAHLDDASDDTILVSLADKLDNARAILRDFRDKGPELWKRFSVDDPQKHLWYDRSLLAVYERRNKTWLVDELRRVLGTLEELVGSPALSRMPVTLPYLPRFANQWARKVWRARPKLR
jgi:hypothetical protein